MAYTAELAFPDEIGFAATAGDIMFFLPMISLEYCKVDIGGNLRSEKN